MRRRILVAASSLLLLLLIAWLWWSRSGEPVRGSIAPASAVEAREVSRRAPRPAPVRQRPAPPPPEVEEPPATGDREVRCSVGDALDGWTFRVLAMADQLPLTWRLEGEELVFSPPARPQPVVLVWGDHGRHDGSNIAQIAWTEGNDGGLRCVIDHLPHPLDAAVYGRVRGAERLADGTVFLEGCGLERRGEAAPLDVDGGFFFPAESGTCRLRAWRQAGMLRLPGPWVEVDADAGGDVEVDLEVPTYAPAGMGIGFRPMDSGVLVNMVHDGTPAAEAGLAEGDVITSIDGVDTAGMDVEEFLFHGVGPAGTEVHLEGLSADGESFTVTLHRREID